MARKKVYFDKRVVKLGPAYFNCNERQSSCTRRNADPRNGCHTCEYTVKYQDYRKSLEEELAQIPKSTIRGMLEWPSDYLIEVCNEVASIHYTHPKGIGPKWDVVTTMLVMIYRDELSKMKAIDNMVQDVPSNNNKDDEDEGDFD